MEHLDLAEEYCFGTCWNMTEHDNHVRNMIVMFKT